MPPNKRYSSCDACHRSRIGCNASTQQGKPCHNCVRRGKACTFTRQQSGRAQSKQQQQPTPSHNDSPTVLQDTQEGLSRTQEATRLHDLLWDIFARRLEPRIGMWISAECCPFFLPSGTTTTLISKLVVALDAANGVEIGQVDDTSDSAVNQSLMSAVYAYSVRWIFIEDLRKAQDNPIRDRVQRVRQGLAANLWRQAQRWLPASLSKPCYRSILALHLLGNAPETGVKDRQGIGAACLQASLNHFVYLRKSMGIRLFLPELRYLNGDMKFISATESLDPSEIPFILAVPAQVHLEHGLTGFVFILGSRRRRMSAQTNPFVALVAGPASGRQTSSYELVPPQLTPYEFSAMEDLAYWFGAIADTSRALLQYSPSILFPGASGDEKIWGFVRNKIVRFNEKYQHLREIRAPLPDEQVVEILQNAFSSKLYCWAAITRVQDSVLHNNTSTTLQDSLAMIQQANNQFEDIFTHLLDLCRRDFMLLNPTVQMSYTLINIHFQVGSLILADIIDEPPVFQDSGMRAFNLRVCACRSIANAVGVALQSDSKFGEVSTQSIFLLDPYPEYIIDALIRTGSSLMLLYSQSILKLDAVRTMFHPIITALAVLSDISNAAKDALPLLKAKFATINSNTLAGDSGFNIHHTACSGQLLDELEHQVATDPALITKSIEKTESDIFLNSIMDTDLENLDIEALSAEYAFESFSDSFSSPDKPSFA